MEYPLNGIRISFVPQKGQALFTTKRFKKGEKIFEFVGVKKHISVANKKSLQISKTVFLESTELFDDNLNHSCDPNAFIRVRGRVFLLAKRDIEADEELSYNYNTSEYDMVCFGDSFVCECGASVCQKMIRGFSYLTLEQKEALKPFLSPYLKRIFKKEKKKIQASLQEQSQEFFVSLEPAHGVS